MKSEKIFEAITEINEEYIEEAKIENIRRKKKIGWKIAGMAAAFFVGVVALGMIGRIVFPGASAGGGTNREPGSEYMSYAGPAFPLTALEDTTGLEFERSIDFDFSPYYDRQESYESGKGETVYYNSWDNDALIRDNYIARNTTDEDITFTAVYPFAGNIGMAVSKIPQITVDEKSVETDLEIGPYSGGFSPAWGDEDGESESLNLSSLESWNEYKVLLENGEYLKDALAENPTLDQKVIVYSFGFEYNIPMSEFDEIDNADLLIDIRYDAEKSNILYYGFNGCFHNTEGNVSLNTNIAKSFNPDFGDQKIYVFVIGEDIEISEVKAVAGQGDYEKRPETDAVTVKTERYETTFGEVMFEVVDYSYQIRYSTGEEEIIRGLLSNEEYVGYVAELLYSYGQLSEKPAERYYSGRLDDVVSETGYISRVVYVTFEVTVPAGETIEICTTTLREASYDFYGSREEKNLEGFDMVTRLGTNLNIIKQSASVSNTEEIEIIYNNFGFDLPNGITKVLLGDEEHYWMEIVKIREEEN